MNATAPPPSARLFLALWPPDDVRTALQAFQQDWTWPPGAALVDAQRLHVTLHFLGQVPVARVAQLGRALAVRFEPTVLDLPAGEACTWRGGIAVLEFAAPPPLLRLHAALEAGLRSLQWPIEQRPWRPHVTLARRAQGARAPRAPHAGLPAWQADQGYALVHSVPGRGYEVLHTFGAP
jgi:2'-5' RNA ligase